MVNTAFNNINKIPVRTYRWLQVNDATIKDVTIPEVQPYTKTYLTEEAPEGMTLQTSLENPKYIGFSGDYIYGISDELTAMAEKGYNTSLYAHTDKNVKIEKPIVIDFLADDKDMAIVQNNIFVAEENSSFTIVLNYRDVKGTEAFYNGITKIYAKRGAHVTVVKLQTLSSSTNYFDASYSIVEGDGKVNMVSIELGGKNSVTSNHSYLIGDNAEGHADTVYLGNEKRYIDLNYVMSHRARRAKGNILVKGALLDESNKLFRGTIDFKRGAARSKGREEEFCMILSPKAQFNAVPLLLCDEDDVEGEHAASAGRIDEEKLFYLRSRGFDEKEAKRIFIEASFSPIIDQIPLENLREEIKEDIKRRLNDAQ